MSTTVQNKETGLCRNDIIIPQYCNNSTVLCMEYQYRSTLPQCSVTISSLDQQLCKYIATPLGTCSKKCYIVCTVLIQLIKPGRTTTWPIKLALPIKYQIAKFI